MGAGELHSELQGVPASYIAHVIGNLPGGFVCASARKSGIAELKVGQIAFQIGGGKDRIDLPGGGGKLIVAGEAGVQFVEQITSPGVAPAGAGVIVAHKGISERALAEEGRLGAENKSVGRIEAIPVQAEVKAVVLGVAVIDF